MKKLRAYVGTYTRGESKGIYMYDMDPETTEITLAGTVEIKNPVRQTISQSGKFLYSCCDEGVGAFKIKDNGDLEPFGTHSVQGIRPCYLITEADDRFLIAAGYFDGKLTILALNPDGSIGDVVDEVFMKHPAGYMSRNNRCHVSCVGFTPDQRYLLAVDLGVSQIKVYDFDHKTGKVKLHGIIRCDIDSSPHHLIWSNDGRFMYVNNEASNTVTVFGYDLTEKGPEFIKLNQQPTVPESFNPENSTTTVKLTPDNRHLMVLNAGDNSLAMFRLRDGQDMERVCVLPISGYYPRDMYIFPDNEHFISINQESDQITRFGINYDRGYIYMNGKPIDLPSPTSVVVKEIEA